MLPLLLSAISVVFGVLAAILWFLSATVKLPASISYVDLGTIGGDKVEDDFDRLTAGLRTQSRLSAWGAVAAATSALAQAVVLAI